MANFVTLLATYMDGFAVITEPQVINHLVLFYTLSFHSFCFISVTSDMAAVQSGHDRCE